MLKKRDKSTGKMAPNQLFDRLCYRAAGPCPSPTLPSSRTLSPALPAPLSPLLEISASYSLLLSAMPTVPNRPVPSAGPWRPIVPSVPGGVGMDGRARRPSSILTAGL